MSSISFKIQILALIFWSMVQLATAQTEHPSAEAFPASWVGEWEGELHIFNAKGFAQKINMSLEISKLDTSTTGRYNWGMVYVSKDKDYRPYELVPVKPELGIWKIDEKNSIVMESYLFAQKFVCWFTVSGSRILCTYEKVSENEMIFEVLAGQEKPVSTTGNTQHGDEKIDEVLTFPFSTFQRAILTRVGQDKK